MDARSVDSMRLDGLRLGGRTVSLQIRDCTVCLGGEFGGNIDLKLACDPDLAGALVKELTLRTPVDPEPLTVLGVGSQDGGVSLSFSSMELLDRGELPESISLLMAGKEIAVLPCRLAGSVPLEPGRFADPAAVLQGSALPPLDVIRTNRWRGPILSGLGLGLLAAGALVVAGSARAHGIGASPVQAGGALLVVWGLIALAVMRVSYPKLQIDLLQGTLREVRGRYCFFRFQVSEESRRALGDFSHVRIVEGLSGSNSEDADATPVWTVSLEGSVAWAGEAGDVHVRGDGLHLKDFASRESALRFAARIALAAGLRILDTSDTGA